jgi:ribonucleoside-diphosphate reductase beta chain
MMLAAFSNMETIHIAAYALLLETIGMPESEFTAFLDYEAMKDKHDYMQKFGVETDADIAAHGRHVRRLYRRPAAVRVVRDADELPALQQDEGHGADRVVVGARREPALRRHDQALPRLATRRRARHQEVKDDIIDCCQDGGDPGGQVHRPGLRDGPGPGHDADDIKKYIRFIADWRLRQLKLPKSTA